MKITAGPCGPRSPHDVKVEIWLSIEEVRLFPLGLAKLSDAMEVTIKDHKLTGHKSTRIVPGGTP